MSVRQINLLPVDLQTRAIRFQVILRWCPILLFATIAVTLVTRHDWIQFDDLAAQVRNDGVRTQTVAETLEQLQRADGRVRSLKRQLNELQQLQPSPDPMTLLFAVSRALEQTDDRLVLSELNITNETQTDPPGDDPDEQQPDTPPDRNLVTRLELNGRAVSDVAVARFVSGLREHSLFDDVRLESSLPARSESPLQREFRVHCSRRETLQ